MNRIEIARRFAAYIPVTLARQIMEVGLPEPGIPHPFAAATLFSDISGFTHMSEELASDGPRGAEELNRVLLTTFTAMIDLIHEMGGAVSHFYGDAMSVYFPETEEQDAAQRALACAQTMQLLMAASFSRAVTNRPPGKEPIFPLTIKIGVGYGRCQEIVVGDAAKNLEFVLTGTAVDEAAAAERKAQAGEVVASAQVLRRAELPAAPESGQFRVVREPVPAPVSRSILDWSLYDETALMYLESAAAVFIPEAIGQRLTEGGSGEIAEHRPVTSLFVDFAFVRDGDEQSDVATAVQGILLHDYFLWAGKIVARFSAENARINRLLTGDKGNQLHIIFGAPVAPDAPEQAIRCALALLREKPAYIASQRIGLAAGKVFAGPVGSSARREYTVVGDMVNLSARLAQACPDDCILTNHITAGRVANWIEFEVLPPIALKGKQEAVTPYRPIGERTRLTQLQVYFNQGKRPLVGRKSELDLLLGGMDAALHHVGGIAAILGAVGVGKTRLLAEGIHYWLEAGGAGLVGIAQQHTADVPYAPWLSIFRDFFNLRVDISLAVQAEQVAAQTKALLPDVGDDVALWGEVLGLPVPGQEQLAHMSAEVRHARFMALARRCFIAFSERTPLLIILEDTHWADQSSLALLDEVTKGIEDHRLFFAVTFRLVDDLTVEMLDRPACVPILLSDLPPNHARDLLLHLVGAERLPLAVEQHLGLRDREGGDSPVSPLFLEESVNVLFSAGILERNGSLRVHEERLQELQIPDTIHGLLLARLDRLPPAGRDLLQVASVIGRQFALEPLFNIAQSASTQQVSQLMEAMSAEDITRLVTTDPEWIYLFQHALTHEVAYESLPYARRQALHHALADWLVVQHRDNLRSYYPILAYHYSQADNHEAGLKYALGAGLDARDLFSNQEALGFFNLAEKHLLALGEEENWETAVELYLARGEVLILTGDFNKAVVDAEISLALAEKNLVPQQQAQALNLLAEIKYRQSNHEEARAFAQMVVEHLSEQISIDQMARSYRWLGKSAAILLDYELALNYFRKAEKICLETNDRKQLASVLESLAFIYYEQRDLEAALDAMERSLVIFEHISLVPYIVSCLNNIALIQFKLGMAEDSLKTYDKAVDLLQGASRNILAHVWANRGALLAYLGYFSESQNDFEAAFSHFDDVGDSYGLVETLLAWGYEYYAPLKKWTLAQDCYEQAEQYIEENPKFFYEAKVRLLFAYGQLSLERNDFYKSISVLEEAEKLAKDKSLKWWLSAIEFYVGCFLTTQGEMAQAKIRLMNVLALIETGANPDYLPLALRELSKIEMDNRKKIDYVLRCGEAVMRRGRYGDRVECLEYVSSVLNDMNHEKADEYLNIINTLHQDQKRITERYPFS